MLRIIAVLFAALELLTAPTRVEAATAPAIERRGATDQLIVDGEPFLILGGELGNSSASSREYMGPHWRILRDMRLNTVLAPIYWDLVEPKEGAFDFSSVDWLIEDARAHDMRLVLLWFGTWKNSMSSYAPGGVKGDTAHFPRTLDTEGRAQEIISVFSEETRDADACACCADAAPQASQWRPGRRLNGDQTYQGRPRCLPPGEFGIQRLRFTAIESAD